MAAGEADRGGLAVEEDLGVAGREVERGDRLGEALVGVAVEPVQLEVAGRGRARPPPRGRGPGGRRGPVTPAGIRGSEAEIAGITLMSPAIRCQAAAGSGA